MMASCDACEDRFVGVGVAAFKQDLGGIVVPFLVTLKQAGCLRFILQ